MQIGKIEIKYPVIVAPMAGVTNDAFRSLCYSFGVGLVCAEMVSDKAIFYRNTKTSKMLEMDDSIHPSSMQLFGSDPATMAYAARVLDKETNCDIIDINMGCPVNKVIKTGAGSALMKNEDLACEVTKAVLDNTSKPVTVKMRLGFDHNHLNYLSLSKKLETLGVSAITLHGRTRSQMYEGKADWSHIKKLHEELKIPVVGNGDIKTLTDYINHKNDCDAIMIGRGLVGNPFLIKEINNYEQGLDNKPITYKDKFAMCLEHTLKLMELKGEERAIKEMRGLAPHYLTGLYHNAYYKNEMSKLNSLNDLKNLLNEYEKVLDEYELTKESN